METGKRSKNFTESEKVLLIEAAKEFVNIIDNKKTDGSSVEAKKLAWMALTKKYNAASETGERTEKQLHALYDNMKKKARKTMSDDKFEKTGGGTFCPKTTAVDENVVALLTPRLKPLPIEFVSSAPFYKLVNESQEENSCDTGLSNDVVVKLEEQEELINVPEEINELLVPDMPSTSECVQENKRPSSPAMHTRKIKKIYLSEKQKETINRARYSIIKNKLQFNDDKITKKKLEILEIQRQQEVQKLEKNGILLDLDIELKQVLLENARLDLEFKKKHFCL